MFPALSSSSIDARDQNNTLEVEGGVGEEVEIEDQREGFVCSDSHLPFLDSFQW